MAATVPDYEPDFIQAGETLKFTKSLSDYPAGTWTLTYYLTKDTSAATQLNFAASADGTMHSVTVAAATTAAWTAGRYRIIGRVVSGSEKYQVYNNFVEILPDLATAGDYRSHAKKVLDAIETVLEGRATKEILSFTVEGQQIQNYPHADLLSLRDKYRAEYQAELNAARVAQGLPSQRRILTRFRRPGL